MEYNLTEEPEIIIVEQPQPRSLRFRYHCENRGSSFSPILGVKSSEAQRSYPTVEVVRCQRRVKLVVHCVTSEGPPFLHHPHKLVGQNCENGVCVAYIGPETDMRFSLSNVGIQCVRKQDIGEELKARVAICSNPYIASSDYPTPINVNSLRLCFQAFLEGEPNKFDYVLSPVVSSVVFDKKSCPELKICDISDSEAPVCGGKKIILLCEKVNKTDIEVAIVFFTPAYHDLGITAPVKRAAVKVND